MGSQPPTENVPKDGESEDPEAKVTRSNFESLAKQLFGVSREAVEEQERRERAAKKVPKGHIDRA